MMDAVEEIMLTAARKRVAALNTAVGRGQLAVDRAVDRWMLNSTPETSAAITTAEKEMEKAVLDLEEAKGDLFALETCLKETAR